MHAITYQLIRLLQIIRAQVSGEVGACLRRLGPGRGVCETDHATQLHTAPEIYFLQTRYDR